MGDSNSAGTSFFAIFFFIFIFILIASVLVPSSRVRRVYPAGPVVYTEDYYARPGLGAAVLPFVAGYGLGRVLSPGRGFGRGYYRGGRRWRGGGENENIGSFSPNNNTKSKNKLVWSWR